MRSLGVGGASAEIVLDEVEVGDCLSGEIRSTGGNATAGDITTLIGLAGVAAK